MFPFAIHSVTYFEFAPTHQVLDQFSNDPNAIIVASTGRSGSTLLTNRVARFAPNRTIIKTHLLPPHGQYRGKILFIFSNPDKSVESIFSISLRDAGFTRQHFIHVETSDLNWLEKIGGDTRNQTVKNNLLSYDALGCYKHLVCWLYETTPCFEPEQAQILAVKYENLWDPGTIQAIKTFLGIQVFELPPQYERGAKLEQLNPKETLFRSTYNLGTFEDPKYAAYDEARAVWEAAPPFQYFRLVR